MEAQQPVTANTHRLVLSWVMRKDSRSKLITGPRRWTLHVGLCNDALMEHKKKTHHNKQKHGFSKLLMMDVQIPSKHLILCKVL